MPKKVYKTSVKYHCPFCDEKYPRMELIDHVEKEHSTLIPENYTATRVVYEAINKTDHGTCMICKKNVYTWNEKISRYNNLCDNPKCREEVRRIALERHMRVYNKPTLLNDPMQQEKMLSNRHISGKYKYSDGTMFTYTGKYEKATIEFMDKVLNIDSKDIQMPGPVLDYDFNGETHSWITDIYYIPANLIIEVKDGGNNPNKREMPVYRGKQLAKEVMITNLGKFNYLRLTNNNFSQLLEALAEIKYENLDQKTATHVSYFINENCADDEVVIKEGTEFNSPRNLSSWMKRNIKYNHTGVFLSPDEVMENKYGDCHDQAYFESVKLKEMGYKTGRIFMVEYRDWNSPGGATHTICYYIDGDKYYWFENAWADKAGIHGPYKSLTDLKDDIADNWQWSGKNNKLFMSSIGKVKPGMTLEEYVVACTPEDEPKPFAKKGEMKKIKEEVNAIPSMGRYSTFIIPYTVKNAFDIAIGNDKNNEVLIRGDDDTFKTVGLEKFEELYQPSQILVYNESDACEKFEKMKSCKSISEALHILTGHTIKVYDELMLCENLKLRDFTSEDLGMEMIRRGVVRENEILSGAVKVYDSPTAIKPHVILSKTADGGCFIHTPRNYYLSSDIYPTPEDIPQNVIDTMEDLYVSNAGTEEME